jgi:hypothetical protein
MRADSHDGPELRLHHEAEYIDAALTFVSPPTSSCDARPDHTNGTGLTLAVLPQCWDERTFGPTSATTQFDPDLTFEVARAHYLS